MVVKFETRGSKIALFSTLIALTTVANFILVSMPYLLAEYNLSRVLIYSLGVLINPITGGLIVVAQGLGNSYKLITSGFPPVFVLGTMAVCGLEASLISSLIRLREAIETITATRWEISHPYLLGSSGRS